MAAVGFSNTVASWHASSPPDMYGFRGFNTILALQFAATGSILAIKRPGNPIGWLFLLGAAIGYGTGLQGIADRLAALDGELNGTSTPGVGTSVFGRVPPDEVPA